MKRPILLFSIIACAAAATVAQADLTASKDQIVTAYDGNTLYQETSWYEFAGYYNADGTAHGRGWSWLGEETSTGRWQVKDDGLFCMTWDRDNWGGGAENCYRVEIQGDKTTIIHVSGDGGEDRSFTIKKGNPYQL